MKDEGDDDDDDDDDGGGGGVDSGGDGGGGDGGGGGHRFLKVATYVMRRNPVLKHENFLIFKDLPDACRDRPRQNVQMHEISQKLAYDSSTIFADDVHRVLHSEVEAGTVTCA
ncbi:hypothetical protein SprV_0200937800 [Sparganum proliferum]